ncbi:M28 family peptidase [Plastoroseomonas arctica]|uniref:Carboxypeptidase Q n=1 Tax=Plastoroseomonas arctica TaxID=1509237 RepID=A0AAF1JXT8_9PROT|nr:M28 family peptidase [Plastoroseomonas arctica]MBR0656419.1 M28 family peptidase [Plastoroseomonas arctica]
MSGVQTFLQAVRSDAARLEADFAAICATGGRLQGTPSADAAFSLVEDALARIGTGSLARVTTAYHGWSLDAAAITIPGEAEPVPCAALVGSVSTEAGGVVLELLDLGRGAPSDVAAAGDQVRGRAVLVQHEYAFATDTIHRRVKLRAASDAGAAAIIMVQPGPGHGPVSGGANGCPVPAFGVGVEGATRMLAAGRARFSSLTQRHRAETTNLILDLPGKGPGHVVLSAHLDGHPLGQSAIDNATGVAALLSLARAAAPRVAELPRGLKLCVFGAEEWSLSGSRAWLAGLSRDAVSAMAMNLNLDSIAGSPRLTAMTSGFHRLGAFVQAAAAEAGFELAVHLPISISSDHANFAHHGVPAMRLIAGFNEPDSVLSRLLTGADTQGCVPLTELRQATEVAGAILWRGLTATQSELDALRQDADSVAEAMKVLAPLPV